MDSDDRFWSYDDMGVYQMVFGAKKRKTSNVYRKGRQINDVSDFIYIGFGRTPRKHLR